MVVATPVQFDAVSKALSRILAAWKTKHGNNDPDLTRHGNNFDLTTKAGLLKSTARGYRLIDPALVTSKGPGENAYIVQVLKAALPNGGPGKPAVNQMPDDGPPAQADDIQTIVDWINGGCLD